MFLIKQGPVLILLHAYSMIAILAITHVIAKIITFTRGTLKLVFTTNAGISDVNDFL